MASRRQARRDAMVVLYQHDMTGAGMNELYNNLQQESGHAVDDFTREEVESVLAAQTELDQEIDACSRGWPSHRLAALERSILRIGMYEIKKRPEIPIEAAISEAVMLAKRFCSREAASLVNGVLGKAAESSRGREDSGSGRK